MSSLTNTFPIKPHQDGPAYYPVVAILSLGSPAVMNFTPHSRLRESNNTDKSLAECTDLDKTRAYNHTDACSDNHQDSSILLMPCSLLIFKDEAYSDYLHGIEDNNVHQLDKVVNVLEAMKHHKQDSASICSDDAIEPKCSKNSKSIERTNTRVSLTCRLVLKVHKKLFKL